MTIWVTSDTHFGHANIIKFCNRPYTNVNDMNDSIIHLWNSYIKPEDTVYHLGDFSFKGKGYFEKLNGNKHLIIGNHDHSETKKKLAWGWVKDYYRFEYKDKKIILFHYPIDSWDCMHHGSIHLHGHIHSTKESNVKHHGHEWHPTRNRFDVGWDYYGRPISLDEIFDSLNRWDNLC